MKPTTIFTALLAIIPTALAAPPYGSTGAAPAGYDASHENFCSTPELLCCKNILKYKPKKGYGIGGVDDCDLLETAINGGSHADPVIGDFAAVGSDERLSMSFAFCKSGYYAVCCAQRVSRVSISLLCL